MPTKSANGGALLYIKDTINYKLRPDLNVEKEKELESIFIEILQKTSKNFIIGCIYRHPQAESFKASDRSRMPPHTPKNLEMSFFSLT